MDEPWSALNPIATRKFDPQDRGADAGTQSRYIIAIVSLSGE
jgi:hypothetical protein